MDVLIALIKRGMLGGSVRGGIGHALLDWLLAWVNGHCYGACEGRYDRKVRSWGRTHGISGN